MSVATMEGAAPCPTCGEALMPGARFCEACGAATGVEPGAPAGGPAGPAPACVRCGGEIDADGYCTNCGHRAVEPVAVDDRGTYGYATHRGRRHHRNEDAAALCTTGEGWTVLVAADGVSASPNPHLAAQAAVATAAERLADRPFGGAGDLDDAVALAHHAASAVPAVGDPAWPDDGTHPACTLVIVVAAAGVAHVANAGDARAYVVRARDGGWAATQVSTDDSVAAEAVAAGADPEEALNAPAGHAITAWLGADAPGVVPHLATAPTAAGDLVLACSDGLWNYAATDAALSDLLTAVLPPPDGPVGGLAGVCERLVSWAIEQGGADNIVVALAPAGAATGEDHPIQREEET
ncbi:MAG TPA: protein phosphatase 2C domain-containing protein [Acidimicrobiales bacterium]|nr:protein phosphatase 2C domain-containing protein [Acidimicrobiales bacterium]